MKTATHIDIHNNKRMTHRVDLYNHNRMRLVRLINKLLDTARARQSLVGR